MTPEQKEQLGKLYNDHLEMNIKADEGMENDGYSDTESYERDLAYSHGVMDGVAKAVRILTGEEVTKF